MTSMTLFLVLSTVLPSLFTGWLEIVSDSIVSSFVPAVLGILQLIVVGNSWYVSNQICQQKSYSDIQGDIVY